MNEASITAAADQCQRAMRGIWEAEWLLRDLALVLSRYAPSDIRAIAAEVGTSHRNIRRWAALAAHFPAAKRSPEYSVRTHSGWMRDDLEGRERRR